MNLVVANPALRTAFALSTLARLPVPMLSIGLPVGLAAAHRLVRSGRHRARDLRGREQCRRPAPGPAGRRLRPVSSARGGGGLLVGSAVDRRSDAAGRLGGSAGGAERPGGTRGAAGNGSAYTGVLLGLWGAGSLLGGLTLTRLGYVSAHSAQLALVLAALTAGHLALAWAVTSELALAGALLLAGAAIAPMYATVNGIVEQVAPRAMTTEAFAWLTTAAGAGAALGAALTGIVAEHGGPPATFLVAGGAGAVATVIVALRAGTLDADAPLPPSACCTTPDPAVV
jgi:Major Facilitator Superfamily